MTVQADLRVRKRALHSNRSYGYAFRSRAALTITNPAPALSSSAYSRIFYQQPRVVAVIVRGLLVNWLYYARGISCKPRMIGLLSGGLFRVGVQFYAGRHTRSACYCFQDKTERSCRSTWAHVGPAHRHCRFSMNCSYQPRRVCLETIPVCEPAFC